MADAEDLKSSGDFSSCGFDSHPGHQFVSILVLTHKTPAGFSLLALSSTGRRIDLGALARAGLGPSRFTPSVFCSDVAIFSE